MQQEQYHSAAKTLEGLASREPRFARSEVWGPTF